VSTFRNLLHKEQKETTVRYERYSQYGSTLKITTANNTASLEIHGIHDARPPLRPGDIVIIRPHIPIHLNDVHDDYRRDNNNKSQYRKPPVRVEIHSQVVRTIRGKGVSRKKETSGEKNKDKVIITWLDGKEAKIMLQHNDHNNNNNDDNQNINNSNAHNNINNINSCKYTVQFIPSKTHVERLTTTLEWLSTIDSRITRNILFPTEVPTLPPIQSLLSINGISNTVDDNLNEKQSLFVSMVLNRTEHPSNDIVRPPMILTGPAGTGKTRALLVAILKTLAIDDSDDDDADKGLNGCNNIEHNSRRIKTRILVCTPSHTACDVITGRLGKYLKREQLFRLYDSTRPIETIPTKMLEFTRQDANGKGFFALPSASELLKFRVVVCTCTDAHILHAAGFTNASLRTRRLRLEKYVRNMYSSSNLTLIDDAISGSDSTHFTHLFVDEAAQATEPESLVPLSVVLDDAPGSVKVEIALVGDPRQLSPDILSSLSLPSDSGWWNNGLRISLLERLLRLPVKALGGGRSHLMGPPNRDNWAGMNELIEYSFHGDVEDHGSLSVFLTTSYRGHPSFLYVPSEIFYFGKLRSATHNYRGTIGKEEDDEKKIDVEDYGTSGNTKWCMALRKLEAKYLAPTLISSGCVKKLFWPIHFRGVLGKDVSVAVEPCWGANSWCNREEAYEVVLIVENLVQSGGVSMSSIGVMAAFRAQVVLVRRLLRERNLWDVDVGSVEDYQAVERDVIVLSLTRSSPELVPSDIGACSGLYSQSKRINVALTRAENILIVVGNPLSMVKDDVWREWLRFCYQNGLWYGENGGASVEKIMNNVSALISAHPPTL